MSKKIILDCDNTLGIPLHEVDDGLALIYLLGRPQVNLLGITTTFGNGKIDEVYSQTQKLVNRMGLNLPILKGEGQRGQPPTTAAAQFLAEQVEHNPQEITILATGPLGNLFAASQLNPNFYAQVKEIVIMGGYLSPVKLGYRNLKELNLSASPAAAYSLLHAPCPVTVFTAQACLDAPYRLKDIARSKFWPGWLRRNLIQWLLAFGAYTGQLVFYLWDLLPAVYLVAPELFEITSFSLASNLCDLGDGMLIKDTSGKGPILSVCSGIKDDSGFTQALESGWKQGISTYLSG